MPYQESKNFWREPHNPPHVDVDLYASDPTLEEKLLEHIVKTVPQGHLDDAIAQIDIFAKSHWMMNLGPEKAKIIKHYVSNRNIKKVLEIGGYCGYSALQFCKIMPQATIHTIQISQKYAEIAGQIQKRAGVGQRVKIHIGTVESLQNQIKSNGPYDMIFIDHVKHRYLQDFHILQKYGIITKGVLVIGDNIITPGSPDYLAYFKENEQFNSILEHSYVEYCDIPDAILISQKINDNEKVQETFEIGVA